MATTTTTSEQREHAKERTEIINDLQHGRPVEGLGKELGKVSKTVEKTLREKGNDVGETVADALETQRRLVEEKDLANRFMRIRKRLEDLKGLAEKSDISEDFAAVQAQMESLRPLVMLVIRSTEFRKLMSDTLKLAKKLIDRNAPKAREAAGDAAKKVEKKAKKEGIAEGAEEAKKQVKEAAKDIKKKVEKGDLITDEEWEKITEQMDETFRSLQRHQRYREGIDELFNLASSLRQQFNKSISLSKKEERAVKEFKKEAVGFVAEFSGEKVINELEDMINDLYEKIKDNERIEAWWEEFKSHTQKIGKSYKSKDDLKEYRKMFDEGYEIFEEFRDDINKIVDQMGEVVDNITNDKLVKELREKVGSISDELVWQDKDGNSHIDTSAAKSLAATITEAMQKEFKLLALPGIRYKDGDTTLILEDIIVSATLPDNISFHLESYANFDIKSFNFSKPGKPDMGTEIYLTTTIKGITFDMHEASFKYEGTLISDAGKVSISVPKPGADLTVDFVLRPYQATDNHESANIGGTEEKAALQDKKTGRYSLVKVKTSLYINDLDVKFQEQGMNHPYLLPTLTSFFKVSIINEFEGIIEKLLNNGLKGLGESVVGILNQAANPLSLSSLGDKVTATLGGVGAFVE